MVISFPASNLAFKASPIYRTLASNLLTSTNYSLSLNAATLRLAQGEYVTDVRFEFGTVPSGFSSGCVKIDIQFFRNFFSCLQSCLLYTSRCV